MGRKETPRCDRSRSEHNILRADAEEERACAERVAEPAVSAHAEPATLDLCELLEGEPTADAPGVPEASANEPATSRARWRPLFAAASSREVLARLVPGDPLKIRAVVAERVRARCYLCDADRVYLRAVARVARFAVRYRGQPAIDAWLAQIVDEALLDLLRDELEGERAAEPDGGAGLTVFADLARPLGLDPMRARAACARFNHLPEGDRAAFFALLVESRELDDCARASGRSPTDVARAARRALEVFLAALDAREKQA